jgi:hypothetical protein
LTGDNLADVRLHTDCAADKAAQLLNARAFTLGRSIYLASGEYNPSSTEGLRLLAHEAAHAVQQRGAIMSDRQNLAVSSETDAEEIEAERFADAAISTHAQPRSTPLSRFADVARIRRAIRFNRTNDAFTTNTMAPVQTATGFSLRATAIPLFEWSADVTITGNPGDPFGNFQAGPLQVIRSYQYNVYWGTGANRTHRANRLPNLPIRDSLNVGHTWYNDARAQGFAANGDTKTIVMRDSPGTAEAPWNNPLPPRTGNSGTYNYEIAFVSYISARDTTLGTGANAFTHLGHVYWNTAIDGTFTAAPLLGPQVPAPAVPGGFWRWLGGAFSPLKAITTSGGAVVHSSVYSGSSWMYPSMHGGPVANGSDVTTDT